MRFYDKYLSLCLSKGVSPTKAAADLGINKGSVAVWKRDRSSVPCEATLRRMSVYFNIDADELLETVNSDPETVSVKLGGRLSKMHV